jgi:Putative prokaryotic signal transducing protein
VITGAGDNVSVFDVITELQSPCTLSTPEAIMAEERNQVSDSSERPDPNEELVKVFDSEQESEALVVSGLLESAGIDCTVTSTDAAQNIYPGVGGSIVLVREEQAEEARRIIAESREETTELDLSGEPQ